MNFSTSSSKPLIAFSAMFALLLAGLFGASEVLLRTQVAPQDEFILHAELLATSQKVNAAFGDSHVARGFVPSKNMVNLAYPSESIPRMAWKAEHYYKDLQPGRVLIQADPHMFAPYRLGQTISDYPKKLAEAKNERQGLLIAIPRYRANLVNYWASLIRQGGRLKSQITMTPSGAHLSPGDISKEPEKFRQNAAITRLNIHNIGPDDAQILYRTIYSKMLTDLKAKGAAICMVTFPISPDYRDGLKQFPDPERENLLVYFKTEAQRTESRYVDWQSITDIRSNFRDTDHLNGTSATHLSPQLLSECFD